MCDENLTSNYTIVQYCSTIPVTVHSICGTSDGGCMVADPRFVPGGSEGPGTYSIVFIPVPKSMHDSVVNIYPILSCQVPGTRYLVPGALIQYVCTYVVDVHSPYR